ncbi:MAG TPA: biotin--[acetyl-CoA-carboxylase] ligase [Actinophytocola sp.]|uniref:biotin--[acetyl-CoA-carboxylase] ligase n=1 Tax=Actinophytocola sp. TaxID=1872138 RepID=UPI002DDD4EC6|nr:biotin--[acetyl-CoA-carboxylase] ligase [Actinophytocola sp.]HEV2784651.1 biotin--[acetyl-CoA-carboxylase] ligase [Actinophytocola sp.]
MSHDVRTDELKRALVAPFGPYAALEVVPSTGSTNADLIAAAARDAPDRSVLIAGEQTAGRGRRSREWVSPPSSGVYLSVLLRPAEVPAARLGGLALVAGVALVRAARDAAGVDAVLKWPNDLLAGPDRAKCAGVLSEAVPGGAGVVVGIGLNVERSPVEIPPGPGGLPATSLAECGAVTTDRTTIAGAVLAAFAQLEAAWREAGGDLEASGVLAGYRDACGTLGQRVRVELPDGTDRTGVAADVDAGGALVIKAEDGTESVVSAGDVVHLRAR